MPRRIRHLAILAAVLASLVGTLSATEALGLSTLEQQREAAAESAMRFSFMADPAVTEALTRAQVSALSGMKGPRALVLGLLAVSCLFAFAAAVRLVRSGELPLEGLRRILSGSLLASALLRTIDGAMMAAVAQRMGRAAAPLILEAHPDAAQFEGGADALAETVPTMMLLGVAGTTALIAGGFLLLAQYFRSDRVKEALALLDVEREG